MGETGRSADSGREPARRRRRTRAAGAFGALAAATVFASSALVGAVELDPGFGESGVVVIEDGSRYEAQGAPLVGPDGRIAVAGLLRNASDRVFLQGLNADGTVDTGFGTNGTVQTSVKADDRRAAVTNTADGLIVVAGLADSGRLSLQRFTAAGAVDTSFGSNGTLAINVPGGDNVPTSLVATGGSIWVGLTNATESQRRGFTVAKLTSSGVDTSFAGDGVASFSFGSTRGQVFDVAVGAGGKVYLAGNLGSIGSNGSNSKTMRLHPNGSRDDSWNGDGFADLDASRAGKADHGVAIVPTADGGAFLLSDVGDRAAIARLSDSAGLNGSYSGDGILGGLEPASSDGFEPVDMIRDEDGGISVTGSAAFYDETKWAALRSFDSGADPLDTNFGEGGFFVLDQCTNAEGNGPSGIASPEPDSLLIAGSCEASGNVAVARLTDIVFEGPPTSVANASLEIEPTGAAAGHERILIENLDAAAATESGEDLASAALRSSALRSSALRSSALRSSALRSSALRSSALRSSALRSSLLSSIALRSSSWQQILGIDVPLQTLTLDDAYNINPDAVDNLTFDDIDPNSLALRSSTIASLVLGQVALDGLPAPTGGWCAFLEQQPYDCSNGADTALSSLFELEISGDDLTEYYSTPISLREVALRSSETLPPVAAFRLADLDLDNDPYDKALASEFASILACGASCGPPETTLADLTPEQLGNATVEDLVGALPQPSLGDLTVGDVLVALVPPAEIPYENTDLRRLLDEAEFRDAGLQAYRVGFTVDCGSGPLRAVAELADDARVVPGSARVSASGISARLAASADVGDGTPVDDPTRGESGEYVFDLAEACATTFGSFEMTLRFDVEAGSVLGLDSARARVETAEDSVAASDDVAVDDSRDPGDGFEQALALDTESIRTGHIASDTDIDSFTFEGVPGDTTIRLSHVPEGADFDLIVYGPPLGPDATALRSSALRSSALRSSPVPDSSAEPTDPSILPPDTVQDTALRSSALRSSALRSSSINRGDADEATTIEVRPEDAGETFTVQVIGYNGSSHQDPYVIRRSDRPAPAAKECPSRSLSSGYTLAFPENVPASAKALYLVHPGRLAARYGQAEAEGMVGRLEVLASETDGVIVPVDADPTVSTAAAFAAADADPCSAAKQNEVVTKINAVVDHVRELGNGLDELRSIVLVGSDEILPQARIPDRTVLSNESDYADEATTNQDSDADHEDNAVSRSLRDGYLLSDDPYGDFDPAPSLWVPDVALGRLVETPQQITGQIDAFLDSSGVVAPQRAFVTGYDFITDGAQAQLDALSGLVPAGAAQGRIDETWTAGDANAGFGGAGAGLFGVNAHYDHHRLLPAAAFNNYDPDLLSASQVNVESGSVAFTIGCHSGLNLAVASAAGAGDPRLGDWVERMASQNALYAANTGFGYGDTEAVAYSERLFAEYAARLESGEVTTGQALMYAKQQFAASLGILDDYSTKSSMEATFYGLPMYRIGAGGGEGEAALPEGAGEPGTGPETRSASPLELDLANGLHEVETERGSFWQYEDEDPLVVQHRPVEPKTTVELADSGAPAKSFLIEQLVTKDLSNPNPVIARPTVDLTAHEPEPNADAPFFPARLASVESAATAEGTKDFLTFIAGSTRDHIQRLVQSTGGLVLGSTSNDWEPPVIRRVDGGVFGDSFSIRVEAEGDDILGGNVLYVTNAQVAQAQQNNAPLVWKKENLSVLGNGLLATGGAIESGTEIAEAIIQVYDTSHNVATSNFKVLGHTFIAETSPEPGDPRIVLDPETPSSGYYESPPQVTLDPGNHENAQFEVSIDGGEFEKWDGNPFQVGGEGEHQIVFRGSDDSVAVRRFAIDTEPPTIVATADRAAGEGGWYAGAVTVSFTCADAVSGVASCPDPVTLDQEGRNQSVSGTATDNAGHSASTTFGPIEIDKTAPAISGSALAEPNAAGWYKDPVPVRYTCTDSLSGVAECAGKSVAGGPSETSVEIEVGDEGAAVEAVESARDRAGNTASGGVSPALRIDRTAPSVAITQTGGGGILGGLFAGNRLSGTASDALSGVARVVVHFVRKNGTQAQDREATLTCAPDGNCTWQVAKPGGLSFSPWVATAEAFDVAGGSRLSEPRQLGGGLLGLGGGFLGL